MAENSRVYFVKSLGEVEINTVKIVAVLKVGEDPVLVFKELREAGFSVPEAMLVWIQLLMDFKMINNGFPQDPLQCCCQVRGEREP